MQNLKRIMNSRRETWRRLKDRQTEEEYLELLGKYIAIQDYFSELTADLQIEDEEIDEYYQEELEFQKNSPSLAAQYSKVEIVTEPASRLVKHILIKIADEDTQAISSLRQENKAKLMHCERKA